MGKTRWQDRDPAKRKAAAERYRNKPDVRARRNEQRRWKRSLARGVCPECQGAVDDRRFGVPYCDACSVSWYHGPGGPIERVWHEPAPVATIAWHTREPARDRGTPEWWARRQRDVARIRCTCVSRIIERRVAIATIRLRRRLDWRDEQAAA